MRKILLLAGLLACIGAGSPAFADHPPCYPPYATNMKLAVSATIGTATLVNPAFIVTFFCPGNGKNGYLSWGFFGYISELVPDWSDRMVTYQSAAKATLDAAWDSASAGTNPDPELLPAELAQFAATWPPAATVAIPKTTGTTVYYVIQQPDKFVAVPVGTAPTGTACNASQAVDGMMGVPVSAVTWYGNVKPLAVVAPCN